ncbi:hypothetical protein O988_06858, partial [Pseudogymnoascus sp. VKM F-3808]
MEQDKVMDLYNGFANVGECIESDGILVAFGLVSILGSSKSLTAYFVGCPDPAGPLRSRHACGAPLMLSRRPVTLARPTSKALPPNCHLPPSFSHLLPEFRHLGPPRTAPPSSAQAHTAPTHPILPADEDTHALPVPASAASHFTSTTTLHDGSATIYNRKEAGMSNLPEHERDHAAAATGVHETLPGPASYIQHVRPRRRPPRPKIQPEPSPEPGLRAALDRAAATIPDPPRRRPHVPAPATAAAVRADPLEDSAAAQPNQQYAPHFAQQFQGMYVSAPGAHRQTHPGGMGMPQQCYAGVFAPQQQVPSFSYHPQAPLFATQTAMFPGQFAPQHGGGSGQSSRRPSGQLSVGGWDVGNGSSSGPSSSIRGPPRKPAQSDYALWVGNLPPAVSVLDLKEHFAQGARENILSVFLIAKSSCA